MDSPQQPSLPRIFVCHSGKDNDFATRLVKDLRFVIGDDSAVWDSDGWANGSIEEIAAHDIFLVILSPDAMASPRVNNEIDIILQQKDTSEEKIIIPLLYRECQVRDDLTTLNTIWFLPPTPYNKALNELLKVLGLSAGEETKMSEKGTDLAGLRLGDYQLLHLVKRGGLSHVYLAEEIRTRRQVAVDIFGSESNVHPDSVTRDEIARLFHHTVEVIGLLNNPHILPLLTKGEQWVDGTVLHYIVTPFYKAGFLTNWLKQHQVLLSFQEVAHLVRQAADALQHVHDRQIIHCSIKPANFLVDSDVSPSLPDLFLSDFAIAVFNTADSGEEKETIWGTPAYMSPEHWEGHPVPATDQYALAIMTYELLAGRLPFHGTQEEIRSQHLTAQPQPPSAFNDQVPPSIDAVVLRALAKRPTDRYASISAFALAFEAAVQSNMQEIITSVSQESGEVTVREGQLLGNYRLVRLLGHSRFARVYLGEHLTLKTQVAVKVPASPAERSQRQRLRNEAHILADLQHPNIIQFVDFDERGEIPFLVTELAPNGTLGQQHPRGMRLSLTTIISYVKQVASALQYMHDRGYSHRYVRPTAMLVGQSHEILLGSFSIAISSQHTSETIEGAAAYMAPEQRKGKPCFASDQYALGVVVYQWLCGRRPFDGTPREMREQHLSVPPPSVREQDPTIPLAVEQVVMKALAKNSQERFASVQEFANALEQASSQPPNLTHENRVGQELGNYRLLKHLGRVGYAEVYLAENKYLGTRVAIKVLKERMLEEYEQEQLRTEASLMMTLDHPHIIRVFDFGIEVNRPGIDDSTFYIVMEYAPLGSLRHLYPRGTPMPLQRVVLYIKQVAEALQYAHDHVPVVVHRDVKPENMLVRKSDDVALSDFVIAVTSRNTVNLQIQTQQIAEMTARKELMTIPGTAAYLAPERLQRLTRRASDQYSLAVVAYEWLCGHPPFDGSDLDICNKHLNAPPPSLSRNYPIPDEVERVIMKALAKEPEDRYKSVTEFALALEAAARSAQRATPVAQVPPLQRPVVQTSPTLQQPIAPTALPNPVPLLGKDDILITLSIGVAEALRGTTRQVTPQERGRPVTVTIPANAYEGQIIRLEGKGKRRNWLSRAGALVVQIHIEQEEVVDFPSTPSASPAVELLEKVDSPSSLASDVRSAEPILTSPTIVYEIFLATFPSSPLTIGRNLEVSLYLSPVSDNDNPTGYRFELPRNEAVGGELNILLTAPGFQFNGESVASLPIEIPPESETPLASQVARFTLVALRPGTAKVSAEVYHGSDFLTNLEAEVQVLGLVGLDGIDEDYRLSSSSNPIRSRPVPQPDLILQIQTEWNTDASACKFWYVLNSFHRSSSIRGGSYRSPSLPARWVERSQRLLGSVLEECVDGQSEDVRARLASLGYYLFQSVFPLVLQNEFRNLVRSERTLTLLVLADQDGWLPWELLHTGQAYLGEQFVIGRWMRELDEVRPYEFPVGGVHVAHYANVPQPEMWVDLLTFPNIPEPLLLPVFADLEVAEAMRGLHLIRYGHPPGPVDLQDAPVMLDTAKSNGSVDAEFRPAKLSLRRNRPLVSLGYASAGQPELTALDQAWAPTFVRAGCSAFVGPMWAVQPTVQAAFVSGFYSRLWAGDSLAGALQMGRRLAKAAAPDSLDWLAYVLFGDPMARPYRPVQGQGYALVEPIGREMDDPVPAGGSARFRVSLRRTPPVWHEERVIEVAETLNFANLQVYVVTFGLDVIPSPPIAMKKLTPDGDYLGWFNLSVPPGITAREVRVQVHFEDGMQPIHSLTFTLRLAIQGGDTR